MLKKMLIACGVTALFAATMSAATAAEFRKFSLGGMDVIALADIDTQAHARDNRQLLVGLTQADADKYLASPEATRKLCRL